MASAPEIIRLSHVAFRTAALEEMVRQYTTVLGLWECRRDEDGTVHLTCGGAGADLELIPATDPGLDHVAFDLAPASTVEGAAAALEALGIETQTWERQDPNAAASVGLRDIEGNQIQLIVPDGELQPLKQHAGIRPRKLGHVATRVRDSRVIRRFYEDVLGFRWSDSNDRGLLFMRCNADHHAANFIEASRPGEVHHLAFELEDDFSHVQRAGDVLGAYDLPILWGPGRHSPGHNIFMYYADPDGHFVELFNQLDRMSDERQGYFDPRSWHEFRPQHPRVWTAADRRRGGMAPPRPEGFFA